MADIKIFTPPTLGKPLGQYSQITRVKASEYIFIAGQVGISTDGIAVPPEDFDGQCVQIFANLFAALQSCDADWSNVVQFTTYMVDPNEIPKFMAYRLREFPKFFANGAYPPNTLLMINRLVHAEFRIEVSAIAAL
ncbi:MULTISPECIES: RidA family protein [unclassified Hyphomicrobium]|uniref:RidA family protein n=1 Tax=unclassified Hyphomicrobium TaxID=2619925 RepID=UPI0002F76C58|nr:MULTISPECIES: RidA family protein [unclassified Hyphomicrobium]